MVDDALRFTMSRWCDFSQNYPQRGSAFARHVNDISAAFYITRRLNANEHNEPQVRPVGRSVKFRTDITLNWIWCVSLTSRGGRTAHGLNARGIPSFRAPRKMKSDDSKIRATIYGSRELIDRGTIDSAFGFHDKCLVCFFFFFLFFFSRFRATFSRVTSLVFSSPLPPSLARLTGYFSFMVTDSCIVVNHISAVLSCGGRSSPRKAPPGLAPFLLMSCQVRVATRSNGRRTPLLLHRETLTWAFDRNTIRKPLAKRIALKDWGQRWNLGPHLTDWSILGPERCARGDRRCSLPIRFIGPLRDGDISIDSCALIEISPALVWSFLHTWKSVCVIGKWLDYHEVTNKPVLVRKKKIVKL